MASAWRQHHRVAGTRPHPPSSGERAPPPRLPCPQAYLRRAASRPGRPPKFVQGLLGHATIAIALYTYSHVMPGMGERTATAMQEVLSPMEDTLRYGVCVACDAERSC